jgi:hypothetical protein
MTSLDEGFGERAVERIWKLTFAIASGGAILAYVWGGWTWSAGFLLGAGASAINFRLLKKVVDALGSARPTSKRVAVLAGLRYALLGGGAYAILKYSSISITATLVGLFVSVAAVIVEIVIQLAYART